MIFFFFFITLADGIRVLPFAAFVQLEHRELFFFFVCVCFLFPLHDNLRFFFFFEKIFF